jgi:TetR/AcrR family transcriptional regulator, regulator of cefoperazone and chloramphenicol sensitivity
MSLDHPFSCSTRARLVDAGLECFAAHGYLGAGIREIAARAHVNTSLVTYHFGGKAGLYRETLRYILGRKGGRLSELVGRSAVGPGSPRQDAIQGFRDYIRMFLESIMPTGPASPLDEAAMALLCREMEAPTPEFADLLAEYVRPIATHIDRILQALRPDLDEAGRFAMGLSIQGQMVHLRNALGMIRLLRGDPAWPRDLGALVSHFTEFGLRGLGLAEAAGAAPAFIPIP